MAKRAFEHERALDIASSAILQRERVNGTSNVRVPAKRRKDGSPYDELSERPGERGQPAERAFPNHGRVRERVLLSTDSQSRPQQWWPFALDEPCRPGELDGRASSMVQHADGEHRAVGGVNTGE
jgi:hypothetical protein